MSNTLVGTISTEGNISGNLGTVIAKDGKSAYEVAVKNGFEGTEAEWLESLKGEQGERGEQGEQGIQGERGADGTFDDLTPEQKSSLFGDVTDEGVDNFAGGYIDTVDLDDNAIEARIFQELIKAGIIPEGATEYTGGVVKGSNNIHLGSGFTEGTFDVNVGRGNYTKGKNAKAIGYEQFVDGQDSTGIGTMNIIRAFRAGFIYGCGNIMTPDNNKQGDTEPSNGYISGFNNECYADSCWIGGIYNRAWYENVYMLGRKITAQNERQFLLGFNPSVLSNTFFALGDGTDTSPHNAMNMYKNSEGRVVQGWFNYNVDIEGYMHCRGKATADGTPTADNDLIRLKEHNALVKRVKDLEDSNSNSGADVDLSEYVKNTEIEALETRIKALENSLNNITSAEEVSY